VKSLDRTYLPHFARSMGPFIQAGLSLVWHCDGNVMPLVPRLLEIGFDGFQGFQYEDGVDYAGICRMKPKSGREILVIGGVSVTRTLPYGTPEDVKKELKWLVENGPSTRLFLGASSSIAPGVPWANLKTLVEGFHHYRMHGRR
jgi:uroporphyrinogen decarboxylase